LWIVYLWGTLSSELVVAVVSSEWACFVIVGKLRGGVVIKVSYKL
jgi:hypothetical protein